MIDELRKLVGPVYRNNLTGLLLLICVFLCYGYICSYTDNVAIAYFGACIVAALFRSGLIKYIDEKVQPESKQTTRNKK